jgi:hypothetical protein
VRCGVGHPSGAVTSRAAAYIWRNGAWRSLVAHLLWEQGVAGSNPAAPIGDRDVGYSAMRTASMQMSSVSLL